MSHSLTNDDKYVLKGMLYDAITRLNSIHNEMMSIHQLIEDLQKKLDTPQQTVPSIPQKPVPSIPQLPQQIPQLPLQQRAIQLPKPSSIMMVASESEEDLFYEVDYINGTCTCDHYKYRGPLECKHIKKARSTKKNQ